MKRYQQSECAVCGCSEGLLLHNVRQRGTYRRLCSNCVLKSHQGLFCPICLQVYDNSPPPPHLRLICAQCPSICHLACSSSSSASSFVCPPCSNPNFAFFDVNNKKLKVNGETKTSNTSNNVGDCKRSINVASARALVAAAKIAALSMSKAAAAARLEVERRVKEAALAKKRAKEALERLLYLATEEKERELKKGSGVSVKSNRIQMGADGNNEKNGGEKGSNGLYSLPAPATALASAAGQVQHQEGNHGMGK